MRGGRRAALTAVAVLSLGLLGAGFGLWRHQRERPAGVAGDPAAVLAPLANVSELLAGGASGGAGAPAGWRIARLRSNPQILVIEFDDLRTQGLAFNRLAALTEKNGAPRDRILLETELALLVQRSSATAETFYFGHDYGDVALARFFNLAISQPVALNPQEQSLRDLLVAQQVIAPAPGAALPVAAAAPAQAAMFGTGSPPRAVVSFTRTQSNDPTTLADETVDPARREAILRHELSHGQYFTRPAYREHCWRFWKEVLSFQERSAFRDHLASLDYDPRNEELMVNESQALLMHTPDPRAFDADDVQVTPERLAEMRRLFAQGAPADVLPDPARGTP